MLEQVESSTTWQAATPIPKFSRESRISSRKGAYLWQILAGSLTVITNSLQLLSPR